METPVVLFEVRDRIGLLTLNHPEKRNPLSSTMLETLRGFTQRIADDRDVKVLILRAAGNVFSAGHDLREIAAAEASTAADIFALCTTVMESFRGLPQPVIAQVQGLATAAGCQLVASCDLVMASEEAAFATPGVKIGLFCTTPAVALSRVVPTKKSLEMLLTGTPLTAREALQVGLVNHVVPAAELESATWDLAKRIASASSSTLRLGKRAFYAQLGFQRAQAYEYAQECMVNNLAAHDAQEGIQAFLQKRPPVWED